MASRNKPYEQFGPFILFKKFDTDALGDLWRAGRIDDGRLGGTVALRRLTGGNRPALAASAAVAGAIVPQLTGTSFVRNQVAGVIDGIPYVAWEYSGGRSLRHVVDRARGGKDLQPNPLPIDQAVVIAERVALSLATMADLRDTTGARLSHGGLLPQFVWIGDDGEIRVAGHQMGPGIIASLSDPKVGAEVASYFSPESRGAAQPAKGADVYAMGAVLFLLVSGTEPPDGTSASAFGAAIRAGKTTTGEPIPDDIRVVLNKSFNIDPSMRYPSMTEMKQALSSLAHGGRYSGSTFNLAFYLSTLLKKELEAETLDREKESKVAIAPYLETAAPRAATPVPPMFADAMEPRRRGRMPLVFAALGVAVAVGVGAWLTLGRSSKPAAQPAARPASAPARPRLISEPVVASGTPPITATATTTDAETQKKAFEDAVRLKLQAEMMKLQNDYMAELKKGQSKNAPVVSVPPAAAADAAPQTETMSAAQLDQQRRDPSRDDTTAVQQAAAVPAQQQPAAVQQSAPVPAAQQASAIREGDVVDIGAVDEIPKPLRPIVPAYPPMARQQRIAATVIMTALITETGQVAEVRVLKGEPRFGLNDAAIRAMRATRFSPATKDGKRVRTWFPQTIEFRP